MLRQYNNTLEEGHYEYKLKSLYYVIKRLKSFGTILKGLFERLVITHAYYSTLLFDNYDVYVRLKRRTLVVKKTSLHVASIDLDLIIL